MAGHFVYDVLTFQPEGPYHLGGYCYGGIIAFEMARQLKAIGKTVGLVGLIDAYAPIHDSENFHILNLHHWQHFMANLSVYVRDLYRRGGNNHQPGFQQQLIRNMKIIANRFGVSVRRNPADVIGDESGAVPEHLFNLMQIEIDALNQYHPGRYDGTVTLFRVHRLSVIRGHDPDMGWGKFASSVKRIYTPGCHNNVLSDIYLVEFAKKLRSELEREYPPL
jgi:thioesterase domain-containing protein